MAETVETHTFQTEVKQLLHLMIHSLYSNSEIFLRELISNASDATDKLRFEALSNSDLYEDDPNLEIVVRYDAKANTVTVSDNGIGMSRDEVVDNLGTIARSGTAEFLKGLSGDQQKDAALIGQFGVGFYSSFIVAKEVEVLTRRGGEPHETGTRWVSSGESQYSLESVTRARRGTEVILHLRDEAKEYADGFRLRTIIRKYSDHIGVPILMPKEGDEEGMETVNTAKALWTRSRTDISEDEYKEFYKHVAHDFEDPLAWSHNRVEGKIDYTSLVYIPRHAPFDLWQRESPRGLKLYVQRVFIMDDAEQFLPLYLRFVRGVVDCGDLPLNISREILQSDPRVETIRSAITKRVLDILEKMAKNAPEDYAIFWQEFGRVIKEGPAEDFANKEAVAKLFRFSTTHTNQEAEDQSLDDYVSRMRESQKEIYYICGDSFAAVSKSPHLEVFRQEGIEVILLHDRIDEWTMTTLQEFAGQSLKDIARGELDLGELRSEPSKDEESSPDRSAFLERLKAAVGERVEDIRFSSRLTDSPACLVVGEFALGFQMQRVMQAAGQDVPASKPIFELNPEHALVKRLESEQNEVRFEDLALVLFDQAKLAAGIQLDDPGTYVERMNRLLGELASG